MLFANVCAGFMRCCYGDGGEWRFGWILGALRSLVHVEERERKERRVLALLVYSLMCTGSGYARVPVPGHALRAEVGGGIVFVAC